MTKEFNKKFFEALLARCEEITEENALEEQENGWVLHSGFTTLKDGGGIVLYETNLFQLREEVLQLEVTVVPEFNLQKERIPMMAEAVMHLNYYTPIGAFGIFYPSDKLYLRYVAVLDAEKTPEQLADEAIVIYKMLGSAMGDVYQAFEQVNDGTVTFDEAVEKKMLLRQ